VRAVFGGGARARRRRAERALATRSVPLARRELHS